MLLCSLLVLGWVGSSVTQQSVEKWDILELTFHGPTDDGSMNPYVDVTLGATFTHDSMKKYAYGFYDGDGVYKIRFSPEVEGSWSYVTDSNQSGMNGKTGDLTCTPPSSNNHGAAVASKTYPRYMEWQDGTPYFEIGTTSYAWVHMPDAIANQTVETLKNSPFNKIRMTVFPKWYPYTHVEAPRLPYQPLNATHGPHVHHPPVTAGGDPKCENGKNDGGALICCPTTCDHCDREYLWNADDLPGGDNKTARPGCPPGTPPECCSINIYQTGKSCNDNQAPCLLNSFNNTLDHTRFNPEFWRNYEFRLGQLKEMNVIADLILFHAYDTGHWGFDCLGAETDLAYLRYLVARVSSYRNVWWSLANEWSIMLCKCGEFDNRHNCSDAFFDTLFKQIVAVDPYGREKSIHNGPKYYNHSQPWITHISMQCHDAKCVDYAKKTWTPKPIIMDEIRYEGNISYSWGTMTAEQMSQRFWMFFAKGAYCGHSETYLPEKWNPICNKYGPTWKPCTPIMWWNHGNVLRGESPARLGWLFNWVMKYYPVNFEKLDSSDLSHGIYQLTDHKNFLLIFWDEMELQKPTKLSTTIPAPASGKNWTVESINYFEMSTNPLGTVVPGPWVYTPPFTSFIMKFTSA